MLQLLAVPPKTAVPPKKAAPPTPTVIPSGTTSNSTTAGAIPAVEEQPQSVPQAPEPSVNLTPTSTDPKLPEFRRAGLHLLMMISRGLAAQIFTNSGNISEMNQPVRFQVVKAPSDRAKAAEFLNQILSRDVLKSGVTVTGYISQTSEDGVARTMAFECCEAMKVLLQYVQG